MSDRNVTFAREGGQVKGMFCDWDLARARGSFKESPEDCSSQTLDGSGTVSSETDRHGPPQLRPLYRTGTLPFIPLDRMVNGAFTAPVHVYRYDLESLFYILVRFCAIFRPQTHDYRRNRELDDWDTGSIKSMFNAKFCFLTDSKEYATIMQGVSPEFSLLGKKWVAVLYLLFRNAYFLVETVATRWLISGVSREEERETVAEVNSARDEALTYEKFMAAIGEEAL
jgi:hypothetical protein